MRIKELGVQFSYGPGTALLFSGKLWTHEVPHWKGGERVLFAYFMREEVLRRFTEGPIEWAQVL